MVDVDTGEVTTYVMLLVICSRAIRTGTAYKYSIFGWPQTNVPEGDHGSGWRRALSRPVKELLMVWEQRLAALEWVPVPSPQGKGGQIW